MKRILIGLLITSLLINCSKQNVDTATCDVNTEYTTDRNQAGEFIIGEWKLVQVTSMMPNPTVEDLHLRFTENGDVTTIRNNQQTETNRYEISPVQAGLQLRTNAEPRSDNWHLRNPMVRICANELFLDGGIALDGPGYLFQRVR